MVILITLIVLALVFGGVGLLVDALQFLLIVGLLLFAAAVFASVRLFRDLRP